MLEYNEILPKKVIVLDGNPYEVLDAHVFRKQMRKPVNQTKLRNLLTGKVTEQAFHATDKADEADLITRTVKFLYMNRGEWWFCDERDQSKRFSLAESIVGTPGKFLKPNTSVEALVFNEKIIAVKVPIKVELVVQEAPPAVRGNTAQGGTKQVVLETGTVINTPLFVNEGDILRINTELGIYVERVEKR